MKTKEKYATEINGTAKGLGRAISLNYELDFEEGQVITLQKAESWSDGGKFTIGNDFPIEYQFVIENEIPCHFVNYEDEEEINVLGAEDCEDEAEVLLPAGAKLVVTGVPKEVDLEEMGYYTVTFEYKED